MSVRRQVAMTVGLVALLCLGTLAFQAERVEASGRGGFVRADVRDADGASLGTVRLVQTGGQVVVTARLQGLTPGFHGFHMHERGACEPPFQSAGGHYNPTGATHPDHAGDFPVLLAKDDGRAELIFTTDRFTVSELLDEDGSAVIVHQNRDNYANIPDRYFSAEYEVFGPDPVTLRGGDADPRIACGVVTGQA